MTAATPSPYRSWTHPDGLSVRMETRPQAPMVAIQLLVGAGSAQERPDEEGAAHLLEHLIFRARVGPEGRGLAEAIEELGGSVNAWTSFEQTAFHAVVPRDAFEEALVLLHGAVFGPAIAPELLRIEQDVVQEEILRGLDLPSRELGEALFALAFADHPYGRPVIGRPERLRALDDNHLRAFHRRHYQPANVDLVVVGALEEEGVRSALAPLAIRGSAPSAERVRGEGMEAEQRASGEGGEALEPLRDEGGAAPHSAPRPRGPVVTLLERDSNEMHLAMAFEVPPGTEEGSVLAELLAVLLAQGESSLLVEGLHRHEGLVSGVYAWNFAARDRGLLVIGASLPAELGREGLERTLAHVMRCLETLRDVGVDGERFRRALRLMESDALYRQQGVAGLARHHAELAALGLQPEDDLRRRARLEEMGVEAVRVAAREWLRPEALLVALMHDPSRAPEGEAVEADEALLAERVQAVWEAQVLTPAWEELGGGLLRARLPSGMEVLFDPVPGSGLVSLRAGALAGSAADPEDSPGLTHLMAELLAEGSRFRGSDDIARQLDDMAATLSGFSGRSTTGLKMTLPARDLWRGLELFGEVLFRPAFPEEAIARVRRQSADALRTEADRLALRAWRLAEGALFEGHPFGRHPLGTEEALEAIRRPMLLHHHGFVLDPRRIVVGISGDADADLLYRALARWPVASPSGPLVEIPLPAPHAVAATQRHEERLREQSHVVLAWPTPGVGDPDAAGLQVLAGILGGQGGRLFASLRDAEGLVYDVSAEYTPLHGVGILSVHAATAPARLDAVIAALRAELERIGEEGVEEREVERARRAILARRDERRQWVAARAAYRFGDRVHGLPPDYSDGLRERLAGVDAQQVRELARRWIVAEHEVLSVVGPLPPSPTPTAGR